jgi:hypothetical protein
MDQNMIPLLLLKIIVHLPLQAGNLQYSRSQVQIISQENSLQVKLLPTRPRNNRYDVSPTRKLILLHKISPHKKFPPLPCLHFENGAPFSEFYNDFPRLCWGHVLLLDMYTV